LVITDAARRGFLELKPQFVPALDQDHVRITSQVPATHAPNLDVGGAGESNITIMTNLSSAQLRKAADIKDKLQSLEKQLAALLGSVPATPIAKGKRRGRRKMSAADKARQSAMMREYWRKRKAGKK
jgi:hypothetical protein